MTDKKLKHKPSAEALRRRVACDDYVFKLDGEEYHAHHGEYVVMKRKISQAGMATVTEFFAMASEGIQTTDIAEVRRWNEVLWEAAKVLADLILEWNWTDDDGTPLPEPHKAPEVIANLHVQELVWLIGQYYGPAEVPKNSSDGSSDT